jgi:hypothetical protein
MDKRIVLGSRAAADGGYRTNLPLDRDIEQPWQDDSAAIARAIERGVSGTGDPHRGNGFSEVFREALQTDLVRARSAAEIDIRSGRGRVGVRIVGGTKTAERGTVGAPRRGTWIAYTITTA